MFLKPGVTLEAAKRLAFQINYRSEPNWLTYRKLLMLADILFEKLAKYKPQDFIDIQSFIWYVSDDIYDRFGTPAFED
jgi:ABC-type polysaccharide/polyol phosphate transport system ATPase subunit